jgi:transposase
MVRSGSRRWRQIMDFYAGLDVSLETTSMCVADGEGLVIREGKFPSDSEAVELFLA